MRDIPASITAIQGSQLQSLAINNQEDLVRVVPGVTWQNAPIDTSRIIVRGVAPGSKGELGDTTSLLIGDVPFENNYAPRFLPDPFPFDIDRVEVLKGPQGTLFGSGSLNGTVRYLYAQPEYNRFGASYLLQGTSVTDGGTGLTEAAMVNIPAGESFAARLVGSHRVDPGYNDNLTPVPPSYTSTLNLTDNNWRHQGSARILTGWRPSQDWEVHLNFSWEQSERNGSSVSNNPDGIFQNTNQRVVGFFKYDYSLGELKIIGHFGGFDLVAVTGGQGSHSSKSEDVTASIIGDVDPATTGGFRQAANDPAVHTGAFTQEIRLVSTDSSSPWRWVVGANYSNQTSNGSSTLVNFSDTGVPPPLGPFTPYVSFTESFILNAWNVRIEELAAFADVTRKFLDDKVEVSLGARQSHYTSDGTSTNSGTLIELTNFAPPGSGLQITNSGNLTQSPFSPKGSVTWRPTSSIMTYATIDKGFRLGGIQSGWSGFGATQPLPQFVKSDYLWNYEVGLRTTWLQNTLHVDVAGFHYDWKNAQYTESVPSKGAFYTTNVGQVKGNGVEAAIQYLLPIDGFSINASAAYADVTTAVGFPTALGTVPTGTQWPGSFKWQTASSLNYSRKFDGFGLNGAVVYTTLSGGAPPFGDPPQHLGYHQTDAQLGVGHFDSGWIPDVTFVVRNLTNDKGLVGNLNDGSLTGAPYTYLTYIQPRTYILQLSKSF